jgi:type II secretion system protein C
MGQYLSWLANSVLFVLCCFLLADAANEVFAALLTPTAEDVARAPAAAERSDRDWADREIILKRNLFNASLLAPAVPDEQPVEDLEATRLPLRLLGTAAAKPQEFSWAAVEDEDERRTAVVQVGDPIHEAMVQRIERRRIVLSENGVLRELALEDEPAAPRATPPRRGRVSPARQHARARPGPRVSERVQQLADDRFQMEREDVDEMMRNPANLFSQARILPKYEGGEMVGLQINAIKPGSFFEKVGIQSGDVITELNGVAINSPQESARILTEFSEADELKLSVKGADGEREINFNINDQ